MLFRSITERYILKKVTSAMVMSSVSGSAADIPQKVKRYNELTDMDVYTWVTLADCELPVRKGSLTPINEGYARSTNANRETKYPMLVRDKNGDTAHHNDLSAQIKAAEKRMAEIAVLRTHIVNYAKTREVYVAYRKAGYSKKFREEHEEEILLHQAAKNAFDEMGVKKLPKVKELQTEYAKLLEEKKKTYSEYRRSREEMRELLTAKANVDRVLKMEVEQDVEKEKDHGQR